MDEKTKCAEKDCGVIRTDEPDYSAMQPMLNTPLGWYSGDDGEFCPQHIAEMMALGNRRPYAYFTPGGGVAYAEPTS